MLQVLRFEFSKISGFWNFQLSPMPAKDHSFLDVNPCPAKPVLSYFENTVDPDQLASDEAI